MGQTIDMGKGKNGCGSPMSVSGEPLSITVEDGDPSPILEVLDKKTPTAIIMRGLPGSGKSTLLEKISEHHQMSVHSTDSYHIEDGIYLFQPSRLGEFHKKNQQAFRTSIESKEKLVVCDNTNLRHWEYEPYLTAARGAGYRTLIVMVKADPEEAAKRNLHGVPEEKVQEMYQRMEL